MNNIFARFSPAQKGAMLIAGGILLLLYTLGVIEKGLTALLILGAIIMIIYGILIGNYHILIKRLFQKNQ